MPAIRKRRLGVFVFGPLALLIAFASPAAAPPGDLDPSFDGDGRVTTDFDIYDQVEAVAIQSDQKIVAVGNALQPIRAAVTGTLVSPPL
ncbi:MAG TPA: hypothetical protein VFH75_00780 [Actinomycetota bacterium]|nr:hypothetical protein [Actinomycetota bacterium]